MGFWDLYYSVRHKLIQTLIYLLELLVGPCSLRSLAIDSQLSPAERVDRVESALRRHSDLQLQDFGWDSGEETDRAENVLADEVSDDEFRMDLAKRLAKSMRVLRGYKSLIHKVEERRKVQYDSEDESHEKKLLKLWKLLKADEELEARKSKQWQQLGFQGDDPATDFRGMGLLGLEQLIFFAQYDVDKCETVMQICEHELLGFPFAIAGITITSVCRELLTKQLLRKHFSNSCTSAPTLDNFHQVYCRVFALFGNFWLLRSPESVMQFNGVKEEFVSILQNYLQRNDANLLDLTLEQMMA